VTLTAGSGAYTLVANGGADKLIGGSGPDMFEFPVIPKNAGHIQNWVAGDTIDIAPLLKAAGYAGTNPLTDGWVSLQSDGRGDTRVYFNPHNGSNHGLPSLITTVDHVAPATLNTASDWVFH
jgi:hypothetical protein